MGKVKIMVAVPHILHFLKLDCCYPKHLEVNSERFDQITTRKVIITKYLRIQELSSKY